MTSFLKCENLHSSVILQAFFCYKNRVKISLNSFFSAIFHCSFLISRFKETRQSTGSFDVSWTIFILIKIKRKRHLILKSNVVLSLESNRKLQKAITCYVKTALNSFRATLLCRYSSDLYKVNVSTIQTSIRICQYAPKYTLVPNIWS